MIANSPMLLDSHQISSVSDADLPALYKQACTALAQCCKIDECKGWADKAAALKVYAKQAKNEEMVRAAKRIQGRAIRKCGELLREIEAKHTGRPPEIIREVNLPNLETRKQVARDSGLSSHQQKTAVRVAAIPGAKFNELIEQPSPPTVTKLAEIDSHLQYASL